MRKQSGIVQIYLIYALAASFAICAGLGWLLKQSYVERGTLKSAVSQGLETIKSQQSAYNDLLSEKRRVDVITVGNLAEKEIVEVQVEKVVYKIQEVIRNAPSTSCLVQPIDPVVLECMRDLSCDETADPESLSSGVPDGRLSVAWARTDNIR